ncbi:MAG: GIY-YIG nuclease family protein [Patescibacteria group bacterium]
MSYWLYILQCNDNSLYIGITNDLKRRFRQHKNKKGGGYTQAHKVSKIVYTEQFLNRSDALKREAQIKSWPREKKLSLIKRNFSSSPKTQSKNRSRGQY